MAGGLQATEMTLVFTQSETGNLNGLRAEGARDLVVYEDQR